MFINRRSLELNLKIVYYGPAMSGKTTNLMTIHKHANPNVRGELVSLKTREDRTIFFDYMQMELGQIGKLKPRFHLYTVPGQVYYAASRKLVLRGADGVVFVVDSQAARVRDNVESWRNLDQHLQELNLSGIPIVVQYNKRDLPEAAPVPALAKVLNVNGHKTCEAVAATGDGVFDTLKIMMNEVIKHVQQQLRTAR
jgi:signal recognition particle receptor subunit beta